MRNYRVYEIVGYDVLANNEQEAIESFLLEEDAYCPVTLEVRAEEAEEVVL